MPAEYPHRFLTSDEVIWQWGSRRREISGVRIAPLLLGFIQFLVLCIRFKVHVVYGRMALPTLHEWFLYRHGLLGRRVHIGLWLSKVLGVRHVLIPSGCRDEDLKEQFEKVEGQKMCANCGFYERCEDRENLYFLERARQLADVCLSGGFYQSSQLSFRPVRYKCLDFSRWTVPSRTNRQRVVVLHSHATEKRNLMPGKNIKGTPIIDAVMEGICARHPHVEYRRVTGLKMVEMLEEQQAADIVIDQLFYGHWGSTGIESMGVGCAVVCYLRPAWIEEFKRNFPNAPEIPVISATQDTLEEVMDRLVTDHEHLRSVQAASRQFAESFYGPETVSEEFEAMLLSLER